MNSKVYNRDQNYYKANYDEALKALVPGYIINDEIDQYGQEIDIKDQIINSHIKFAQDIDRLLKINIIAGTSYSSLNTIEGVSKYFVKQNNLTEITPSKFELKILIPLNKSLNSFNSKEELKDFIDEQLLPSIVLNSPSAPLIESPTTSGLHIYLIDNLSWLYFLNTTGALYSPSSFVSELLTEKMFFGQTIYLSDCLKGLAEYLWKNNKTSYIPETFLSSTGEFTSGTQQLEKLKTWIEIIYSPLYADKSDTTVKDRFSLAIDNGTLINNKYVNAPFHNLLRMIAFAAFDSNNSVTQLRTLNDIDECPAEYLPLLADLVGWKLFGTDSQRWRLQLRNCIEIYKRAGTKRSIQLALSTLFPKDTFSIESKIKELWESYIPYLIYYSLATESTYFESNQTWTQALANQMNVVGYSTSSLDDNIKFAVDRIIYEVYNQFSGSFSIPNIDNKFFYRGREYPIPPFEEYPYYVNVELTFDMVNFIADRIACFGVNRQFALQVRDYILSNTINSDSDNVDGSWLFFTSGYNEPPNIDSLVSYITNNKFKYVPMWSAKSSHFELILDASSFNFSKKTLATDSADAVEAASKVIEQFAPAHAIPNFSLRLSTSETIQYIEENRDTINKDNVEFFDQFNNYQTSALYVSAYKRNTGKGNVFNSPSVNNLQSSLLKNAISISNVPRNSIRRRSYEKAMKLNGYYDRTGFNMPVAFDHNFPAPRLPLGLIPSSLSYQPITNYSSIPDVYSKCNDYTSSASYYGYYVSNTLACRGGKELAPEKNLVILAGQSNMNGRGQTPRASVTNVNYWDLDASAFVSSVIPFDNTETGAGFNLPTYGNGSTFWGPEVRFAELLRDNNRKDTYLFKFCQDNSLVVDSLGNNTWCPSTTQTYPLYDRFESALDLAISAMGGIFNLKNVTLIWSQGESEAGFAQLNNASALAFSAATMYFLDTVRDKFPNFINFKIIRAKIHEDFGAGSQPDYLYYPNGREVPNTALGALFPPGTFSTSAPGQYGFWSWSSTPTVRQAQDNLDEDIYGPLLNFDDLTFTNDPNFAGSAPKVIPTVIDVGPLLALPGGTYFLSSYASAASFINSSIHYNGSSSDIIGERFYTAWENIVGERVPQASRGLHIDRGQLPEIYAIMHDLNEKRKYYLASSQSLPASSPSYSFLENQLIIIDYYRQFSWKDVYKSYANNATEVSGWTPASVNDYYNFKFNQNLHKLYNTYAEEYGYHKIAGHITELDGANIFSHTYGPLLYNYDFEYLPSAQFVTSALDVSNPSIDNTLIFTSGASAYGTYTASSSSSMYIDTFEYVNSGLVPGVELISTSGSSNVNGFSIIKVLEDSRLYDKYSKYIIRKTFLKLRSVNGLPRIRFDIRQPTMPSNMGYPISKNFLMPDHKFKVKFKSTVCSNNGLNIGGRSIGVWIHTKPELGRMWSFNHNINDWVEHDQLISKEDLFNNYTKSFFYPTSTKQGFQSSGINLQCIDIVLNNDSAINPLITLNESDFKEFELDFNTYNNECKRDFKERIMPKEYQSTYGQLHRKNQDYVVELFLFPDSTNGQNNFLLLDNVEIIDMTMNEMASVIALDSQERSCNPITIPLEKHQLASVFKFFNDISGKNSTLGVLSREASDTSGVMGAQGGSRLDYRLDTDWLPSGTAPKYTTLFTYPNTTLNNILIKV